MPSRLQNLKVGWVSLVDRAAVRSAADPTQPQRFLLWKAEGVNSPKGTRTMSVITIDKAELDPAVREALEKAEKAAADAAAELEKANSSMADEKKAREAAEAKLAQMKKDEKPAETEIDKSELSPAVRELLEKSEAREKAADERVAKAEMDAKEAGDIAKAERNQRVEREFVAKAETGDLRGLPTAAADLGPVLKQLSEAAPEAYATLEKSVLVPAAEQIRKSVLFKEQGRGGEGPPPESAVAKFNSQVAELRKSDSGLTETAAKERVRKSNPELEKAMHDELRQVA